MEILFRLLFLGKLNIISQIVFCSPDSKLTSDNSKMKQPHCRFLLKNEINEKYKSYSTVNFIFIKQIYCLLETIFIDYKMESGLREKLLKSLDTFLNQIKILLKVKIVKHHIVYLHEFMKVLFLNYLNMLSESYDGLKDVSPSYIRNEQYKRCKKLSNLINYKFKTIVKENNTTERDKKHTVFIVKKFCVYLIYFVEDIICTDLLVHNIKKTNHFLSDFFQFVRFIIIEIAQVHRYKGSYTQEHCVVIISDIKTMYLDTFRINVALVDEICKYTQSSINCVISLREIICYETKVNLNNFLFENINNKRKIFIPNIRLKQHKLAVLDGDNSLVNEINFFIMSKKKGFSIMNEEFLELKKQYNIKEYEFTENKIKFNDMKDELIVMEMKFKIIRKKFLLDEKRFIKMRDDFFAIFLQQFVKFDPMFYINPPLNYNMITLREEENNLKEILQVFSIYYRTTIRIYNYCSINYGKNEFEIKLNKIIYNILTEDENILLPSPNNIKKNNNIYLTNNQMSIVVIITIMIILSIYVYCRILL